MTTPEINIRTATADEYESSARTFTSAMLFEFHPSQAGRERYEPERVLLAEAEGAVVGTARALTRDMSVPGAVAPVAHISAVGVMQTYRRRGVLSALMKRQLREVPEAVAALWASEAGIYGRYGYAPAAYELRIAAQLTRLGVKPGADSGTVRERDAASAAEALAPVLTRYQRQRAGVSGRGPGEWATVLDDPPEHRHGGSARRVLVHEDAEGRIDGYALWRSKIDFSNDGPNGEVMVQELIATTPEAYRALWTHLLTMDLCRTLRYMHLAVDEPLPRLVSNSRALDATWTDSLWVRVTDVPRALEQRRYGAPLDLVLEITDDIIGANNGRFHLAGDPNKARCVPTDARADLSVSVSELGAIYLGGRSLVELSHGGAVTEHTPGSLFAASAGFGWPVAPGSVEIF